MHPIHSSLKAWLVPILLLGTLTYALAEELTLTTYYPSPRGMYDELRTKGDVAIGKLDPPAARLEIVGGGATSATTALRIRNVDSTPLLEVQNGGNVGIGTTSPGQKLDVTGKIRMADGTQGAGKVLTSDENGVASWQVLDAVPSGFVGFFAMSICPTGWSPYGPAMGRYVVGTSTSIGSTMGTALSNLEDRPVGQHAHSITDPGHAHSYLDWRTIPMNVFKSCCGGGSNQYEELARTTSASTTNITINNAGSVPGTNAPYIQLLVCQKD